MWNMVSYILIGIFFFVLFIWFCLDFVLILVDGMIVQDFIIGKMDVEGMYKFSIIDVIVVKVMLVKGFQIFVEIVDNIIEFVEYWLYVIVEVIWGDECLN